MNYFHLFHILMRLIFELYSTFKALLKIQLSIQHSPIQQFQLFIQHSSFLQSSQVKRTSQAPINEFIIQKLNP